MQYVQCRLVNGTTRIMITWIPEQFAVVNKFLSIKDDKGNWEDGWRVTNTYGKRDASTVLNMSKQYRHYREVTDI